MEKVKFTNKNIPEVIYEIVGENWLDDDTYVIVFQNMLDVDGDEYHLEVEYHEDENRITYTRVYDYENVNAEYFVSPCFKKQIDEYIMRQVGILRDGSFINKQKISVELTLDIPKNVTIGDLNEWLKELTIEVKSPRADFIRVLDVKNIKQ